MHDAFKHQLEQIFSSRSFSMFTWESCLVLWWPHTDVTGCLMGKTSTLKAARTLASSKFTGRKCRFHWTLAVLGLSLMKGNRAPHQVDRKVDIPNSGVFRNDWKI
ncbi:putative leucine-rich repeat receptor protein kinase family protein [Anopheles sinensis]|uniref:Putative leucine-rich repeat receptor protein kinase family protein n=1 Tax=Anopheles sinensis TaxID=74873 RepID=A0A084WMC3_ANOSI|nr:putative leucine-rich repeat receptor protein kinase family protein [Anopheles sinensis]